MRRLAWALVCSAAVQLLIPATVCAWYGDVDSLSGPGPFWFVDWEGRVFCVEDTLAAGVSNPIQMKAVDEVDHKAWARIAGLGCLDDAKKHPVAWLNLRAAFWHSWKNDLQYVGLAKGAGPGVKVVQLEPSFSTYIDTHKYAQVSSGAGMLAFFVKGVDSFTRFYWKPVELTFYPGVASSSQFARSVGIRFGIIVVPSGFDAADFGAVPGTFHTDREVQTTISFAYDFSRR